MNGTVVARELARISKMLTTADETLLFATTETARSMRISVMTPDGKESYVFDKRRSNRASIEFISTDLRSAFVDSFRLWSPDYGKLFEPFSPYRFRVEYSMAGGHLTDKALVLILRTGKDHHRDLVEFIGIEVPRAIGKDVTRDWKHLKETVDEIGENLARYYAEPGYKGD